MQELKAFQAAICRLAGTSGMDKYFILNIPQSYRGAHMLYNGATMSVMLRPPLADKDIVDRIYTPLNQLPTATQTLSPSRG